MKKVLNKFSKVACFFLILNVLLIGLLIFNIFKLNILPMKYLIGIIIILLLLLILITIFIQKKCKKKFKIVGYIISSILIIVSLLGVYFLNTTNNFLNNAFKEKKNTYTSTYYVLSLDHYENIDELNDNLIGYYINVPNINNALDKLKEKITFETKTYENMFDSFNELNNTTIKGNLIEKNLYDSLLEASQDIKNANYKILYSFDIEVEEEVIKKEIYGNYVNIYVGGPDFTNTNYDFNMIVTINKDTHKILLTSTPRDYYIEVVGKGMNDLLGYAGVWGINTSIASLKKLYNIDINNYVKIDTNSLIGLVDVLNGVEFCSDISYTTTHALVAGTYDDTKGLKLTVKKGCNTYNGIEILTIARERKAYADGDRQRQKNCQQIMINIFNKMASFNSIAKYSEVLNAVSDLYTSNVESSLITEIAKSIISGDDWTFDTQSVSGTDSRGMVHLNTVEDYVMRPNQESVNQAIAKINGVMAGV